MDRLVNPWSIQEHNLPLGASDYSSNHVSRSLGLVGDDGDLFPDQLVEKRRFPGVGPTDKSDKSGTRCGFTHAFTYALAHVRCAVGTVMRRRRTLRRSE